MVSPAMLRIKNDLNEIKPDDCIGIIGYIEQQKNNRLIVEACLIGPRSTRYADDIFIIRMQFSNGYPVSAPAIAITCTTGKNNYGALIIETIMRSRFTRSWNPTFTIKRILDIILGIMRIDLEQIEQIDQIEDLFI